MTEIEVKILEINRAEVEKKLKALGAKKIFEGELYALMFDFEKEQLKDGKKLLRLRKEGQKTVLTFKERQESEEAKVSHELEVDVSDFEKTRAILEGIGLQVFVKTRKNRTNYELDGTHIAIDTYLDELNHIPEFVEIEARSAEELNQAAAKLGFHKSDFKTWGTFELLEYYSKK